MASHVFVFIELSGIERDEFIPVIAYGGECTSGIAARIGIQQNRRSLFELLFRTRTGAIAERKATARFDHRWRIRSHERHLSAHQSRRSVIETGGRCAAADRRKGLERRQI